MYDEQIRDRVDAREAMVPPEAMMAAAARILGVADAAPTDDGERDATVLVTVAGPNRRKVVRVASNVPAGRLAQSLGEAVGVTVVARLSVRGGDGIHPAQTLGEVGVRAGSVILVDEPGAPGLANNNGAGAPASLDSGSFPQYWARPQAPRGRRRSQFGGTRRERTVLAVAVAALAVVAFLLGGALTGGSNSPASNQSVLNRLATRAVIAWLADEPFGGPRLTGVPANLGRSGGPAVTARVEAAGASSADGIVSQQFIVVPATGRPSGLSVVLYQGKVAYPVTLTGILFAEPATGTRTGTGAPVVPQTGVIVAPSATGPAQAWAQATFGPGAASPVAALGFGLSGTAKVLNQWDPKTGAAMVARIQVPLSSGAPGTASATTRTEADDTVTTDREAISADQTALTNTAATLVSDGAEVTEANRAAQAAVAASNAAQAKVADDNAANPPSASLAADTANAATATSAVAAAQKTATTAQAALTADQHAQSLAAAQLAADQKTEQTDVVLAAQADNQHSATVESVYDVAFNAAGSPLAWAPADYLIGQS
jgi:hypothetical protein